MAGRLGFQDASEYRLMKSKLFLDRFRGQANLPADLALAGGDPTINQRKLDLICIVKRKSVKISLREELTAGTCGPEILDRSRYIDAHRQLPGECIAPVTAFPNAADDTATLTSDPERRNLISYPGAMQ
jgi:hypothetical protein